MSEHKYMKKPLNLVVRDNIMSIVGYTPYCGNNKGRYQTGGCDNPRTVFNNEQFVCRKCGWVSQFPDDFINEYKEKWNIH